jgi:tetratricopeptide (TPR) repeat protein
MKTLSRVCLSLIFVITATCFATAQYTGSPVKKDKLVSALRSHQLQTNDIVDAIKTAGVDFQVTPDVEQELVAAGARPQVIAIAKANYRAPAASTTTAGTRSTNSGPSTPNKTFSGKPMTKDAIVTLLENGVADQQVRSNVAARGVDFRPSSGDKSDIIKAGGSQALMNVIGVSYIGGQNSVGANTTVAANTGSSTSGRYNDLIDLAISQYDVQKNSAASIATLKQAIALDPGQPRAYQQVGFAYLYGQKNFDEAENYMKQAIDRGGSAVFRVFHDHGALMTDTCSGSLFISKSAVRYESDNNVHTFETQDASIKNVKVQNSFVSAFNARRGAFKLELKTGENDSKNYNFAPLTNDVKESKMIVRLIGKDDDKKSN